jgi:hypothetical protein
MNPEVIIRDTNGNTLRIARLDMPLFKILGVTDAIVNGSGNVVVTVALLESDE